MGKFAILDMRRQAEDTLGPDFDIGTLHDALLGAGPVPLSILRKRVAQYISEAKARPQTRDEAK